MGDAHPVRTGSLAAVGRAAAAAVTYHYDSNPLDGTYSQYTQGRLAAVEFSEENVGMGFTYQYSYNQAGRVTAQRMTYGDMDPFDANYTWDTEGRMTGINYGPSYTLQYDGNGRLSGMQDTTNGNTVATASYDSGSGLMTGLSYFGFAETRTFNSLLQMTRQTVTNVGTTVMDMQYNFAAGANNGRITSSVDNMNSETVNYAYDALNRLANATAGTWGQGFGYDGFGNLTAKTALLGSVPVLSVSFDAATNHQAGVSYDANGNVMGYLTAYDVENRMIGGYSYDHAGKRVYKDLVGGGYELYFYGIGGQKLVTATCTPGCARSNNVYFGGKLVKSKGVVVATDRLGSVRANSSGESMRYYPYGEERTSTPDNREKFGTYTRDNPSQDYADQRYYAAGTGRFNTPDPQN